MYARRHAAVQAFGSPPGLVSLNPTRLAPRLPCSSGLSVAHELCPTELSPAAILLCLIHHLSFRHREPLYHLSFLHTAPALPALPSRALRPPPPSYACATRSNTLERFALLESLRDSYLWPTRNSLTHCASLCASPIAIPRVNPHPPTHALPIWKGDRRYVLVQDPTSLPCISYRTHNSRICGVQGNAAARAKLVSIPHACHAVHQAKTSPHELPSILTPHPSRSRVPSPNGGEILASTVLSAKTQPTHIAAHLSASPATASAKLVSTVFRDTGAMRSCQLRARCAEPAYDSSTSHFGSAFDVPTNARTQLSARSRAQAACVTSRPPTIHRSFLFLPAQKEPSTGMRVPSISPLTRHHSDGGYPGSPDITAWDSDSSATLGCRLFGGGGP